MEPRVFPCFRNVSTSEDSCILANLLHKAPGSLPLVADDDDGLPGRLLVLRTTTPSFSIKGYGSAWWAFVLLKSYQVASRLWGIARMTRAMQHILKSTSDAVGGRENFPRVSSSVFQQMLEPLDRGLAGKTWYR